MALSNEFIRSKTLAWYLLVLGRDLDVLIVWHVEVARRLAQHAIARRGVQHLQGNLAHEKHPPS